MKNSLLMIVTDKLTISLSQFKTFSPPVASKYLYRITNATDAAQERTIPQESITTKMMHRSGR
jgi:hypothetical protein